MLVTPLLLRLHCEFNYILKHLIYYVYDVMCFLKRVLHPARRYNCVNCVFLNQKFDTDLLNKMSEDLLMKKVL